jgi:hypothetical protein
LGIKGIKMRDEGGGGRIGYFDYRLLTTDP